MQRRLGGLSAREGRDGASIVVLVLAIEAVLRVPADQRQGLVRSACVAADTAGHLRFAENQPPRRLFARLSFGLAPRAIAHSRLPGRVQGADVGELFLKERANSRGPGPSRGSQAGETEGPVVLTEGNAAAWAGILRGCIRHLESIVRGWPDA